MQYRNVRMQPKIILDNRIYKNYEYFIINLHTHPCAYVCIKSDDIYNQMSYQDIPYDDFAITPNFSDNKIIRIDGGDNKTYNIERNWILGWSYDHLNDYVAGVDESGHKYTTMEMLEDVYDFIDELILHNEMRTHITQRNEDSHYRGDKMDRLFRKYYDSNEFFFIEEYIELSEPSIEYPDDLRKEDEHIEYIIEQHFQNENK